MIAPICPELMEECFPATRIDQPVLRYTGLFVFSDLVDAIPRLALGRDDLDHQVSRAIDVRWLQAVGVFSGDEQQVRLAAAPPRWATPDDPRGKNPPPPPPPGERLY